MSKRDDDFNKVFEKILGSIEFDLERSGGDIVRDFEKFEQMLLKWQKVQNLVSRETLDQFWLRHVADCLQLLKFFKADTNFVLDFGSGGGFPAIILAIVLKEKQIDFTLVEANSRKVAFLRAVKRELGLNVTVEDSRIGDFKLNDKKYPDIITARALASLDELLAFSLPFWGENTSALFLKGVESSEELKKARIRWQFNVLTVENIIDSSGVILEITDLKPVL